MRMFRMLSWMLALGVLALLTVGCGNPQPTKGTAVFSIAWPGAAAQTRALADMQSVKIELIPANAPSATLIANRPAVPGTTFHYFADVYLGTYTYLITVYSGANATGLILGQAAGELRLAGAQATITATTIAQPGATLTIVPNEPVIYIGRANALRATATNIDNSVIILPAAGIQWTTSDPFIASIDAASGVATGVGEGQAIITATNGAGLTDTTIVDVRYAPPTVTLTVDDDSIKPGESVKLTWRTEGSDTVVSSVNFNTDVLNGSLSVFPTETTTYELTVRGRGGETSSSVTVKVTYPTPSLTLSANRTSISAGESVTLTWTSSYATSVERAENFNTQAVNGSAIVRPSQTTTYRLAVRGPGGTTTDSVTVNVAGGEALKQ